MEEKTKKILTGIGITVVALIIFYLMVNLVVEDTESKECLRNIAEEFCELGGATYMGNADYGDKFLCVGKDRKENIYRFTNDDRERCKK